MNECNQDGPVRGRLCIPPPSRLQYGTVVLYPSFWEPRLQPSTRLHQARLLKRVDSSVDVAATERTHARDLVLALYARYRPSCSLFDASSPPSWPAIAAGNRHHAPRRAGLQCLMPIPTTQTHGRSKEVHGPVLGCQPCSKMCGRTGTTVWGRLAVVMGAPRPGARPTLIVSNSFCAAHRTWSAWSKRSILPLKSSRWRQIVKPASMSSATTSHVSGRRRASGWRRSTRSTRAR